MTRIDKFAYIVIEFLLSKQCHFLGGISCIIIQRTVQIMINIIIERRRKTHVTYNKFSTQAALYYFEGRLIARRV